MDDEDSEQIEGNQETEVEPETDDYLDHVDEAEQLTIDDITSDEDNNDQIGEEILEEEELNNRELNQPRRPENFGIIG